VEDLLLSVVLRCVKCNIVLETVVTDGNTKIYCPVCKDYLGAKKGVESGTFEDQAITLLTEIRDELKELNS
jgi:phage FluMu protein Com